MTMTMLIPIIMVVVANTIYNLCAHATPANANPFASILVTYITSGTISLILLLISTKGRNLIGEFHNLNMASVILGFGIVLLECGFILAFRAGWNVSTCATVSNIILAAVLFVIGVTVFHDAFTVKKVVGLLVCALGLYLFK